MSIIACRVKDNKIYIAADSMITDNGFRCDLKIKSRKIFRINKGTIIASAGVCEESNMFRYCVEDTVFESIDEKSMVNFMSDFYKMRDAKSPWPKEREIASENRYIAVINNIPFFINQLFVSEIKNNEFLAIGHGDLVAIGAMEMGAMPRKAVEIACKHSAFCATPVISCEVDYYGIRSDGKKKG